MGLPLLSVIGAVLAAVAALFTVIGLATTGWGTITVSGLPAAFNSGLFQQCIPTCRDFDPVDGWLQATRAMVVIGFLLGVACVVVLVVYIIKNDLKIMQLLGMVLAFTAGFFLLIGIIVYSAEVQKSADAASSPTVNIKIVLGWSFALTVVGAVLFVIAGIILVAEKFVMGTEG